MFFLLQNLDLCVKKDPHLAIGYFQRGCLHLQKERCRRFSGAEGGGGVGGGVGGSTELRKYVLMRGRVYVNGSSIPKFHVYLLWDMYLTFLGMIHLTFIDSS